MLCLLFEIWEVRLWIPKDWTDYAGGSQKANRLRNDTAPRSAGFFAII